LLRFLKGSLNVLFHAVAMKADQVYVLVYRRNLLSGQMFVGDTYACEVTNERGYKLYSIILSRVGNIVLPILHTFL